MSWTSKWRSPSVRLPASRVIAKALVQQVVERFAVGGALAQVVGALADLLVGLELELRFEVVDARDDLLVGLVPLRLAYAQGAIQNGHVA